ncbi:MAG: autotransporter-associated beta strand repeat-containing protein, partial [Burkholderiales bacterium]|nr:autotransporter-associated beta strand repeat-containing protein [Opitutaceae bacterium]
ALGSGPLAIGTAATAGNGARLRMAGFSQSVSALSSGATANARVIENFGAANSTLTVSQSSDTTYAGFLRDRSTASATATGNLGLVKDGAGTLTLSNVSNQYTGATVINGGVLEVSQLTNGGIVKTINSTAASGTLTMVDTTGVTPGMTLVAANLPTGFSVSTVDSGTALTINTTAGILTGSSTAHFGIASSLGLSTSVASNLVFGGGTLRYTGATNASTDRNFTVNSGQSAKWDVSNAAATLALAGGAASSTGGFQKLGAGSLVLAGAQAYTGTTNVTAGVLALGAADRIADSSTLVLGGGTFDVNGFSDTLGGLDLDANGFIDLDNVSSIAGSISFAASSGLDWSAFSLSITGTSISSNAIRFGTDSLGLSGGQLAAITVNGVGGWALDGSGYLTAAIPEPSSFAALAGLAALAGVGLRRRRRA